jgi:hypothetical protein
MAPNAMVGWTAANLLYLPYLVPFCSGTLPVDFPQSQSACVAAALVVRASWPDRKPLGRLQPGWPPSGDSGLRRLCEIINADYIKI